MNESGLLKGKIYYVCKKDRKWVLGARLILSLFTPWSLFLTPAPPGILTPAVHSSSHSSSSVGGCTPKALARCSPVESILRLQPAPTTGLLRVPPVIANTERFVLCSVVPCLIPFPESLSYFSNSGLVRSCQHPFPWEPVNKQRRAYVHPLSCLYHLFLRRPFGILLSVTHHGVDCPPCPSGSRRGWGGHSSTTTSPASSNFRKYFLLRLIPVSCAQPLFVTMGGRRILPDLSEWRTWNQTHAETGRGIPSLRLLAEQRQVYTCVPSHSAA